MLLMAPVAGSQHVPNLGNLIMNSGAARGVALQRLSE